MGAIDAAARERDWRAVANACQDAIAHPCSAHAFYLPDLWTGLAEAFALQERYDDAIDALQHAVATGHRAWPHPDTDIARLHLMAGRREEAGALFAAVRARTPDDPWLFRSAGEGYLSVGDYAAALQWFSDGAEVAMASGDPEGLVRPLEEGRLEALKHLQRDGGELDERVATFLREWEPPLPGSWEPPVWPDDSAAEPAPPGPCPHCGWRPPPTAEEAADIPGARVPTAGSVSMGVAWFTAEEWPRAVAQWPHLLEDMPADHDAYLHEIEFRVSQMAASLGARLIMVPISMGGLLAFAAGQQGLDPGSGRARADYAASLLTDGHGRAWPPERNDACWCGSGKKYKACCGAPVWPA